MHIYIFIFIYKSIYILVENGGIYLREGSELLQRGRIGYGTMVSFHTTSTLISVVGPIEHVAPARVNNVADFIQAQVYARLRYEESQHCQKYSIRIIRL